MTKHRVTIKDIAKILNISTSTVSRALADRWDVNPETRKAVLELSAKLNYKPNPLSINLLQSKTKTIGIIIPEFINAFFPEVIQGIQSVTEEKGYRTLICQSNENYETELTNLKNLESGLVDGFIVSITKETQNTNYFKCLIENGFPVVFFNRVCNDIPAPKIIIDDYKWAFCATEHLILQGCKNIAHLAGPEHLSVARNRKRGYMDALANHQFTLNPNFIIPCGVLIESGVMGATKLMELPMLPDGIFAINDPVAIGAMKVLIKQGIKIPEDIAIVGFSESPMATIIEPNLTSIEQPTFEMGRTAAQLLLEIIKTNVEVSARTVILEAKLNIRESSLKSGINS
jgi:DNA-binding LacI/PurR family transcriptional regulator